MTSRCLSVVVALLAVLLIAPAVRAETYGAVLTVSQEVPTPTGTTGGFGNATVTLDPNHTSISVSMTIANLSTPVNNAHIHRGPFGVAGPVVINFQPNTNLSNGRLNATFAIDKALGDEIAANPGNFYVNVHTTRNPGGEIRGQLTQIGDATLLFAELRGENERPTPVTSSAVGSSLVTIDSNNVVTFEINIDGLQNPTLAHIHIGTSETAGNPVVTFATSSSQFSNGRLRGTAQITPELAAQIKANPAGYYVNVHTTANPNGEIRGQLSLANEYDIPIAGNVTTGAGDRFVTDLRIFNPSFTSPAVALVEYLVSGGGGNTNATASRTVVIPPRGQAVLDDVTGANGLNQVGTTGALRITSNDQLAVTSNIYNDQRGAGRGTFGQFVPAVTRGSLLRRGVMPHLVNRTRDAANPQGFRTNVGFFNPNQTTAIVRLELRDATGALVGESVQTLAALSQQQNPITAYFPGLDLSNTGGLTLSFDSSAPILAYAAVNDNVSGDSIFVVAQNDPGVSASQPTP